jgi:predicted  nucleic acid-binding Zn-ribbon protein
MRWSSSSPNAQEGHPLEFAMPQEMSFAQALTEARQIIVQQSNRIKADLDRIKSLQETITTQTTTLADHDRQLKQKSSDLDLANEQVKLANNKLEEMRIAKEQGEAVIDRQGQRLSQMQETIAGLEKQLAEQTHKAEQAHHELEAVRGQVPTQEDTEALAALASLLSAKKGAPAQHKTSENAQAHQEPTALAA